MSVARCAPAGGAELDELIVEAERWLGRDDERCRDLITRAEWGLNGQRDPVRVAWISRVRGDLAVAAGDLGAAVAAYRNARSNWLAADELVEALRATAGAIEVQLFMGEVEAAELGLLRLQVEVGRVAHEDVRVARLRALVQRQLADVRAARGQISGALRQYDAAENLFAAAGDPEGIARVQERRGLALLDAGLTHNALLELGRARTTYDKAGNGHRAATASVLVAAAFSSTGQVARALEVLEHLRPGLPASRWHVARHALVRSEALLRAGFAAEAHGEACAAEEVFMEIGAVESSARAALACGRASLAWGRHRAAVRELDVAERLFGDCGSRLMEIQTRLVQAELAWATGETDACRALCDAIIAASAEDTPASVSVRVRVLAARVAASEQAAVLLEEAAVLAGGAGIPELRVEVLLAEAHHEHRTGQLTAAIKSLRGVLNTARSWERRLGQRGTVICPSVTEAGARLILLLLERGDHAGRVEALRRARVAKRTRVDPPVRRTPSGPDAVRHLDDLLAEAVAPVATTTGAEEVLPAAPFGPLIEYYVAGEDVVAFVVRDGHVDARILAGAAESSRRLVNAWQQECRLMGSASRDHIGFATSAALDGLFDLVLAPVLDLLEDLDDELDVIGHQHLHAVPFDALLDEAGPWYATLARPLLRHERAAERPTPALTALVLAVPDENAPSIAVEAEMIRGALPSTEVLFGSEATKEALARHAAGADVVHFACHGIFRPDDPLASGLRLADGWLSARELAAGAMTLDGAVVVLSACSSGRSAEHTAEPVGLVSACLSAGARGVVAALWPVDDAVTLELMTHFYGGLADGAEPHAALRRARRQVARRYAHPYFWAAFRFVGCS